MFDLHRHDNFSTFDGFGKASELSQIAKEKGHTSLCTTNHGNTTSAIQTWCACKEVGIKSILGVEGYFLPKHKEQHRGYHLVLLAKNLKGYGNINRIQFEGEKQKYYNSIWDFKILEKYHEGLICTSGCVAGYLAFCIKENKIELAKKFLNKMLSIFGDDFYIEIQPYKISEKSLQEKVNIESIRLAKELNIKCILTSDSHRGRKEDLPTYIKMHEIAGHDLAHIEETYAERYMPDKDELAERFIQMHEKDFGKETKKLAKEMYANLEEIEAKCEDDYLSKLELKLPKLGDNSLVEIKEKIKQGLKAKGKWKKEYIERVKEEFEVIKFHHFEDYFLIVADYVNWAKSQGIVVGAGRGSVCNCLIAYALGITEVDSLKFNLDFRRFLRKDKTSFPDIDLDFETARRDEVIKYLVEKYKGHSARIASYGLYKVDNLINDLAKVSGLYSLDENGKQIANKTEIQRIKSFVKSCIDDDNLNTNLLLKSREGESINKEYDDILTHFSKLYKKVRYIGTHSAGVAITGGNLLDYMALRLDKDGDIYTCYDLEDIEKINVIKFDILGLKTMESIGNLRKATGVTVDYDEIVEDEKLIKNFYDGNTEGIFQLEKDTAKKILYNIGTDSFDDVTGASAMNRPGPLSINQPDEYAENKYNIDLAKEKIYYPYTKESYGTIIYQEQIQQICVNIGKLSWGEADKVMKLLKSKTMSEEAHKEYEKQRKMLQDKFVSGAVENGVEEEQAQEIFDAMMVYSFNKGHAVGYTLLSFEEMFYKTYYPNEFWFAKIKYASDEYERTKFSNKAVKDGSVIFLPHINYSSERTRLRRVDGEVCIQQGLSDIKGVGMKASAYIVAERKANGIFKSFDDFYDRCKSKAVTTRVIDILGQQSALIFDKKAYIKQVKLYNSALYSRAM